MVGEVNSQTTNFNDSTVDGVLIGTAGPSSTSIMRNDADTACHPIFNYQFRVAESF